MAKQNPALDRFIREGIAEGVASGEIPTPDRCGDCGTETQLFGFVDGTDTLKKAIKAQTEPTKQARRRRKREGAKSLPKWEDDLARAVIEELDIRWACRDCKPKVSEAVFFVGPHGHIWGEPRRLLIKKDPTDRDWKGRDADSPEGRQKLAKELLEAEVLTELRGQDAADAQEARGWGGNEKGFFETRGIGPEVREHRGYEQWTPHDLTALRKAWGRYYQTPGKRARLTKIGRQSGGGYTIPRFPPKRLELELPPISAEIRPFGPVESKPWEWAKYLHIKGDGHAMRIDVHPDTEGRFDDAERVLFGVEGCMKEDAILSRGEAAFSVPACWQWKAPEMGAFIDEYDLREKIVFVIPDADWIENPQVCNAAYQCYSYLRVGFGLKRVFVAAPPPKQYLAPGQNFNKGVDDYLGDDAGYSVDDLLVIGRDIPPTIEQWQAKIVARGERMPDGRLMRRDAIQRDAEVLQALSLCHGLRTDTENGKRVEPDGGIFKSLESLSNLVNTINPTRSMNRHSVRKAIERLADLPGLTSERAITIDGSLETKRREHAKRERGGKISRTEDGAPETITVEDFAERPLVLVAPELCATDREPIPIREIMVNQTLQTLEQFRTRNVTKERVSELRGTKVAA